MPFNLPTANTAPAPEWPPLSADQQKAVESAKKIVTVLQDSKTKTAAEKLGLGSFFTQGTGGYSTGQFTTTLAITISTALPRLMASQGADVSAWAQLAVGFYKAFSSAAKALSKLSSNDAVYEQLYRDYPFLTYTCQNGQLDFQNPYLINCANARQKAEDVLRATQGDELFFAKLYTWLYFEFGIRPAGGFYGDPIIYTPNVQTGKVQTNTVADFVNVGTKSMQIASFLGAQGRYQGQFNLPFVVMPDSCNTEQIIESVQQFMYHYQNNLLDENFAYMVIIFQNAGYPNPETLKDETRANNYFFESFRTAAKLLEDEKKKKEEQTKMYYYIAAVAIILLLIYYYYSKK